MGPEADRPGFGPCVAGIERQNYKSRVFGATKGEQFDGGYNFFRCPSLAIASNALTYNES
jgi:hypothetical protein